jgi:hypothetical protein
MDFLSFRLLFPVSIGLMALRYLYLGLRGVITRKPLLQSSRWFMAFLLPVFLPGLLAPFMLHNTSISLGPVVWVNPIICVFMLWYFSKVSNGYTVYGVTDKDFRNALLKALEKSDLKFEETMNGIYLKYFDVTLKASVYWMGTGYIRVKGKVEGEWLKKVTHLMSEELDKPKTEFDVKPFLFYLGMAIFCLALTVSQIFLFLQINKLLKV